MTSSNRNEIGTGSLNIEIARIMEEKKKEWKAECDRLGLTDRSRIPEPFTCPVCSSLVPPRWSENPFGHWVTAEADGYEDACRICLVKKDREDEDEEHARRMARAKIPIRLQNLRIEDLELDRTNAKLAETCRNWNGRTWIIASGGVGTGKTSWLTAVFIRHLAYSMKGDDFGMWTTEQRFFRMAQIRAEKSRTGRERIIQTAIDAKVLMIDDLGAGRRDLTEWQGGAMRELLMERHLEGRPTLITTNLAEEAIGKLYGEHVVSRMREAGGFINLGGADRRRRSGSSWLRFWGR